MTLGNNYFFGSKPCNKVIWKFSFWQINGLEPKFIINAFGLSKELSTDVGLAFSNKVLKSKDL